MLCTIVTAATAFSAPMHTIVSSSRAAAPAMYERKGGFWQREDWIEKSGTADSAAPAAPVATKPGVEDMTGAKLLEVQLKIDYTKNPQLTNLDGLKYVLGDGGATEAWAALPGLRHKYFIYEEETQTCSGVYVFYDQASLDAYMSSELFEAQGSYPHVSSVEYEIHDVLPGTEKSIENYDWASTPPTREDVSKAWMIIAHLKIKTDVTPEPALREFMAAQYTESFNKENGPKGLRGKYFTYKADTEICSGYYTFLDKASMDTYMASDLWKAQPDAPNVESVTATTHEVLPGTERAMDLGSWKGA